MPSKPNLHNTRRAACFFLAAAFLSCPIAAASEQLESQVRKLNQAVGAYKSVGGTFSSDDPIDIVFTRLRLKAEEPDITSSTSDRLAYAKSITPIFDNSAPTDSPWAFWDNSKELFSIAHGTSLSVSRVIVDLIDTPDGRPITDQSSSSLVTPIVAPAAVSRPAATPVISTAFPVAAAWTTGKADRISTPSRIGESSSTKSAVSPVASSRNTSSHRNGRERSLYYQLKPPVLSHAEGEYPISAFRDFQLRIENPNSSASTKILYSLNSSGWQDYKDDQPLTIKPGDELLTCCVAKEGAGSDENDSMPVEASYEIKPAPIPLAFTTTRHAHNDTPYQTEFAAVIGLNDSHGIPVKYLNGRHFEIRCSYDGSDPHGKKGVLVIDDFVEGFAPIKLPLPLLSPGGDNDVTLRVIAISKNEDVFLSSEELELTIDCTSTPNLEWQPDAEQGGEKEDPEPALDIWYAG